METGAAPLRLSKVLSPFAGLEIWTVRVWIKSGTLSKVLSPFAGLEVIYVVMEKRYRAASKVLSPLAGIKRLFGALRAPPVFKDLLPTEARPPRRSKLRY